MSHRAPGRSDSRSPDEGLEYDDMQKKAAEFYHANKMPEKIENALNDAFVNRPDDVFGYLANYFAKFSAPPRISKLGGREVYDARGQPSVLADVYCIVRNKEKRLSSAGVPNLCEAPGEDPWGLDAAGGERAEHVATALQWIGTPLSSMLRGLDPCEQAAIDQMLSNFLTARYEEQEEANRKEEEEESETSSEPSVEPAPPLPGSKIDNAKAKTRVVVPLPPLVPEEPKLPGSMAISSVSLAVAKAGAQIQGTPLYKYIATLNNQAQRTFCVPMVLITLLSCGKSSAGKLNLLEEIILVPNAGQPVREIITMALQIQKEITRIMKATSKGQAMLSETGVLVASYEQLEQPLDVIADACTNLGLALGEEIHLAINCAAHKLMDYSKGKYEVAMGVFKTPNELVELYQTLLGKYPSVVALIDPLRKEDVDQWQSLSAVIGSSCSLLSDISSTAPGRGMEPRAPPPPGVRGHFLRHADETTVSDLIRIATDHPDAVLMGSRCSEQCSDAALSDVAVGLGVSYFRLGGLYGAERLTKYNRLISIEEELAQQGILGSVERYKPPVFAPKPEEPSSDPDDPE